MAEDTNNSDKPKNILKCREDPRPLLFDPAPESTPEKLIFSLRAESPTAEWAKGEFGIEKIRPRIEPWLTALFQSEHISLLVGSGLSNAVHQIATGSLCPGMAPGDFDTLKDVIDLEAKRSALTAGRGDGNIEDQIRAATELRRGLEILGIKDKEYEDKAQKLDSLLEKVLIEFAENILKSEQGLVATTEDQRVKAFNYLTSFLMSFASRTGTRDRLHLFTTNYDRFLEAGAETAGMHILDRFVGSLAPIFRSSRLGLDLHYNPPGIRGEPRYLEGVARFTKLHGSLDWINIDGNIRRVGLPFGAKELKPFLESTGSGAATANQLMIYPNAAKDRETSAYPYVELFRDFAAAACRPNHTLVTFGYGFGDEHINRVIEDMLTIPSTHLVVMSYDDPMGRIMSTYEKIGRPAQTTLLVGNHVGGFIDLVDNYLPKPAIDKTTIRMTELLKARFSHIEGRDSGSDSADSTSGNGES